MSHKPEPIRPDGYARDYHTLQWRDLRFEVVPLPGHTFGSTGYLFEVDGKRFLVTGDNISGLCLQEKRDFIYSFIPKNRTPWTRRRPAGAIGWPSGVENTRAIFGATPDGFHPHSLPLPADVTCNGRRLGEIAEAVAYW